MQNPLRFSLTNWTTSFEYGPQSILAFLNQPKYGVGTAEPVALRNFGEIAREAVRIFDAGASREVDGGQ